MGLTLWTVLGEAVEWSVARSRLARADLSRFSHRLVRQHRTREFASDTRWTVTCQYGLRRTGAFHLTCPWFAGTGLAHLAGLIRSLSAEGVTRHRCAAR
jgi:hypothetical protein